MSRSILIVLLVALVSPSADAQQTKATPGRLALVIETERGNIDIVLDSAKAPVTVANFLRYVDKGAYKNGVFHRAVTLANQPTDSVKIQVIQGGANPQRDATLRFPPIPLERTSVTGLRHHDGTLSMARAGPNTATSDFFICIGDQPSLDFGGHRNLDGQGFAAFGQVTSGMDIVRAIQTSPATAQRLLPPIVIRTIKRKGLRIEDRGSKG
jgi:peptidyl-prolyl cis-trans isomerase A (cyclophilin A)